MLKKFINMIPPVILLLKKYIVTAIFQRINIKWQYNRWMLITRLSQLFKQFPYQNSGCY